MGLPQPLQSKLEGFCGCSREPSKGQGATYQQACEPGQRAPSRAVSTSCGRTYRCARPLASPPSSLQRLEGRRSHVSPHRSSPSLPLLPGLPCQCCLTLLPQPLSRPLWGIRSLEDCSLRLLVLKLDCWFPSFFPASTCHLTPIHP